MRFIRRLPSLWFSAEQQFLSISSVWGAAQSPCRTSTPLRLALQQTNGSHQPFQLPNLFTLPAGTANTSCARQQRNRIPFFLRNPLGGLTYSVDHCSGCIELIEQTTSPLWHQIACIRIIIKGCVQRLTDSRYTWAFIYPHRCPTDEVVGGQSHYCRT